MSLLARIRNLVRNDRYSRELSDELETHIELRTEENIARGLSAAEARAEAVRAFGNRSLTFERVRDADVPHCLDTVAHDLKYSFRALHATRAQSLLVILSLALGIGANTAMFSLLYGVVERRLPVRDAESLYSIALGNFSAYGWVERDRVMNYGIWRDLRDHQTEFAGLFAYAATTLDITTEGQIRLIAGAYATSEMWTTLGVRPIAGRVISAVDEKLGATSAVAVISDSLWESQFSRDPRAIGSVILIGGRPVTIVGVAPPAFYGIYAGTRCDVFLPLEASAWIEAPVNPLANGERWWLAAVGRLRPGVSAQEAGQRLSAMSPAVMQRTIPADWPKPEAWRYLRQRFEIQSAGAGLSDVRDTLSRPLAIASALVAVLLLLACANIATLQLSRGLGRRREFAVRIALGVSRRRLALQVFLENALMGIAGAAIGIGLSQPLARALTGLYSTQFSALQIELRPDFRVLAFTTGLTVFAALLFGIGPALQAIRTDPNRALRTARALGSAQPLQRWLLGVQVALAVVLTAGATMFTATLHDLLKQQLGIRTDNVLLMLVETQRAGIQARERAAFYSRLQERLAAVPGVDSVGESYVIPLSGSTWQANIKVVDGSGERASHAFFNVVSPGYFDTYSTPILEGRALSGPDRAGAPQAVVVNREFARSILGVRPFAGARIRADVGEAIKLDAEIVGVVADAKYRNLRDPAPATVYVPMAYDPAPPQSIAIAIRSRTGLPAVSAAVRRIISELNPKVPFLLRPLGQQVADSVVNERAIAVVSGLFGALALVLAAVGIYGLAAHDMMRRRAEIGLRMALGATPRRVLVTLFRRTLAVVAAGVCAGAILSGWVASFAESLLFGVSAESVWVYVLSAFALLVTAAVAMIGPSVRATTVDPSQMLRLQD